MKMSCPSMRNFYLFSVHCLIEYDGEVVVLHPKNVLVSVDGMPLSEPTRLPQGEFDILTPLNLEVNNI